MDHHCRLLVQDADSERKPKQPNGALHQQQQQHLMNDAFCAGQDAE